MAMCSISCVDMWCLLDLVSIRVHAFVACVVAIWEWKGSQRRGKGEPFDRSPQKGGLIRRNAYWLAIFIYPSHYALLAGEMTGYQAISTSNICPSTPLSINDYLRFFLCLIRYSKEPRAIPVIRCSVLSFVVDERAPVLPWFQATGSVCRDFDAV